jgi:arsenical pump membrane protein
VGAVVVLAAGSVGPRQAFERIGWSTFVLLAGLFVLLDAVARAGLVGWALGALHNAARDGPLATILAAFARRSPRMCSITCRSRSSRGAIAAHAGSGWLSYALIAGVDLGPNLTTMGSLATILWFAVLRERGLEVSPLENLRLGLSVVLAMLIVTSLWLWLVR